MINTVIKILLILTTSFFSAFAVGLNKYVTISASTKEPINKLLLLSEVLVYGLSGFFMGLLSLQHTDNIYMVIVISGSGGMIGQKLLFAVIKSIIFGILNMSETEDKDKNKQ